MSWRARLAGVAVAAALATPVAAAEKKGTGEGIKVHGQWTIEIRNPDGSLASRHEFENALTTTGAARLTSLLASQRVACRWSIVVLGPSTTDTCVQEPGGCLSLTAGATDVTLQGLLPAKTSQWSITTVRTSVGFLESDGSCPAASPHPSQAFTQRALDAPVTVLPEQIVQVKVILSFS